MEPTGHSLRLAIPQAALPATELEWRAPRRWGALERNRAQAYALAQATLVAYETMVLGLDLQRQGRARRQRLHPLQHPQASVTAPGCGAPPEATYRAGTLTGCQPRTPARSAR
jgi:hypothetical protein